MNKIQKMTLTLEKSFLDLNETIDDFGNKINKKNIKEYYYWRVLICIKRELINLLKTINEASR